MSSGSPPRTRTGVTPGPRPRELTSLRSSLPAVKRPVSPPTVIGERPEMSDEDRAALIDALWKRLNNPNGLDWETLENIEQLTERPE